jgi:hypothetical protein
MQHHPRVHDSVWPDVVDHCIAGRLEPGRSYLSRFDMFSKRGELNRGISVRIVIDRIPMGSDGS